MTVGGIRMGVRVGVEVGVGVGVRVPRGWGYWGLGLLGG